MTKAKIGVVSTLLLDSKINRVGVSSNYINALEKVSGIPIMIPVISNLDLIEEYINICDGFLFTGGMDINPFYYNMPPSVNLAEFNNSLDWFQLTLMKKVIESKKPFLAICRGIQILNIACGGTLYQDISEIPHETCQHVQKSEGYNFLHTIKISTDSTLYSLFGSKIKVNSFHHQCINKLGDNLKITAIAPDNIIEGIELINYQFGIGVQWHPEMMLTHSDFMKPIFEKLIEISKKTKV